MNDLSIDGPIRIKYLPLSELIRWPRNPKEHDLELLRRSLLDYGFTVPLLRDERSGRLVAGHGRLEILQTMKRENLAPPKRIMVRGDGEWLVPVLFGVEFESEEQAERYLLVDNRSTELGGWNATMLAEIFSSLDPEKRETLTGFNQKDIDGLLADFQRGKKKVEFTADPDAPAPEPPAAPVTREGDVWQLGDHRLMCGDSTSPVAVARLMEAVKASLISTDPPYGVSYVEVREQLDGHESAHEDIANDGLQGEELQRFLEAFLRASIPHLIANPAIYIWHPVLTEKFFFQAAAQAIGMLIHRQIVWAKPSLVMGRGDIHWKHELCLYGWIQGKRCRWLGPRNVDTVWDVGRENDHIHPTQKPVELFRRPLNYNTLQGEVVYEPFGGSGSGLIAAEELGRRARVMELKPAYCDVIIERWEGLSGQKAKLIHKG